MRREDGREDRPDVILRKVSAAHRLRPEDLRMKWRRQKRWVHAREEAMYLLRRRTTLTLREIGELLGGVSYNRVWRAEAVAKG